mmetsp:Transcript_29959/g.54579  ORF Transcript_29959/g.54579 Transcript_29959/m.54579 type:complete len:207 (+) Transcript_29959:123-743(+)
MTLSDLKIQTIRNWLLQLRRSTMCIARSRSHPQIVHHNPRIRWPARGAWTLPQVTLASCEKVSHTAKAPLSPRKEECIQANGLMAKRMAWAHSPTRMGTHIVASGLLTKLKAMGCTPEAQEQPILVNGSRISTMGLAPSAGEMEVGTAESLWKDSCLGKVASYGQMGQALREHCSTMRWITESTLGLMAKSTLANGRLPDCMGMES